MNIFKGSPVVLSCLLFSGCAAIGQSAQNSSNSAAVAGTAGQSVDKPEPRAQISLSLPLHDKKDRPLADVQPAQLSISDAGHMVDVREIRVTADTSSNDHLVTFLFDQLDPAGIKNAERAAERLLKQIHGHTGAVGVLRIGDGLQAIQPYTLNQALALDAIRNLSRTPNLPGLSTPAQQNSSASSPSATSSAGEQNPWNSICTNSVKGAEQIALERRAPINIASVIAIAEAQRAIQGRKVIVYLTQGSPVDTNAADLLQTASQVLKDAGVSLFVMDMNALDDNASEGMAAAMAMGSQALSNRNTIAAAPKLPAGSAANAIGPSTLGLTATQLRQMSDTITTLEFGGLDGGKNLLEQVARSTGGTYSNVDPNFNKIGRQMISSLVSYTITYPAPATGRDGTFHPVLVSVAGSGKNGVARTGYFAAKSDGTPTAPFLASRFDAAASASELTRLSSDAAGSDLQFHSSVLRFGASTSEIHNVIALEIPVSQLQLQEDANTGLFSLHASAAAQITDAAGQPIASFQQEFRRHGSIDVEDAMRSQFLSATRQISLPPGDYRLNTVIRDWNTGKIGTSKQTIHIDSSDDAGKISDLVLVQSTLDKAHIAEHAAALQYGQMAVVPNLSGQLPGDQKTASLYFQLYPGLSASELQALHVEVSSGGKVIAAIPLNLHEEPAKEGTAVVVKVKLDAGAGRYDLVLCSEHGGHAIKRQLSLLSLPGTPDSAGSSSVAESSPSEPANSAIVELGLKPAASTPLSKKESAALITAATENALSYSEKLPNFICAEKVLRSFDTKGTGDWKQRDAIVELLRYHDRTENRTILEVNGVKSNLPADRIEGAHSVGEFGGILQTIFAPSAKAEFRWLRAEQQSAELLQVFSFDVKEANSDFYVTNHNNLKIRAGFHGLIFIDNDTRAVRRLIAQTTALPPDFGIRSSWMAINYDYIAINNHDYLLPIQGEVGMQQGKKQVVLNELHFSEYRRFGSHTRILDSGSVLDPAR